MSNKKALLDWTKPLRVSVGTIATFDRLGKAMANDSRRKNGPDRKGSRNSRD